MRIWTSYFANPALRERRDLVRVAITRWPPRWRGAYDEEFRSLAPSEAIFRAERGRFGKLYRTQLEGLGIGRIAGELKAISRRHEGADLVLLCFEASGRPQDCHRGIFRAWWEEQGGPSIEEIPKSAAKAKRAQDQLMLPLEEGAYET